MRVKIFAGTLLLLILNATVLLAQTVVNPCLDADPDGNCPLDTWVIILATAAVVFATFHLYRKRSQQKVVPAENL